MKQKLHNSGFARMYLWVGRVKFMAGLFFMAFAMLYFVLGFAAMGNAASLEMFTAIQMMLISFIIGILQQVLIPNDKLNQTRGILWIASSALLTIASGLLFQWFKGFPTWCAVVFFICTVLAMVAMLLEVHFELHRETRMLNENLKRYQNGELHK